MTGARVPAAVRGPRSADRALDDPAPKRRAPRRWGLVAAQVLVLLVVAIPLLWMVSVSFKPAAEPFRIPAQLWPDNPTWGNYASALRPEFRRYLLNSALVSLATIVVSVTAALLAAYALSRFRIRGARMILLFIIAAQMFPAATLIIPIFEIVRTLELLNTYVALVGAYVTITLPVTTWMILGFVQDIPRDMEQAALVDGASRLQAFWHIVVPAARPGIAASAVWVAVVVWQELLFALSLTTSQDMRTVSVGLNDFIGQYGVRWGELMAGSVVMSIPVVVLFSVLQRHFVAGLTQGASKG